MRALPLGPSMELPVGRDPCEGRTENGRGDACEHDLWGRRWSSLWGTIHVRGVPTWAGRRDANLVR